MPTSESTKVSNADGRAHVYEVVEQGVGTYRTHRAHPTGDTSNLVSRTAEAVSKSSSPITSVTKLLKLNVLSSHPNTKYLQLAPGKNERIAELFEMSIY